MLVHERRQAELRELAPEERARREKQERRKAREQEREAKRFAELSQAAVTQESIAVSQRDLAPTPGSQSRLRLALQRKKASQSQGPQSARTEARGGIPEASQAMDDIEMGEQEPLEEFVMSGDIRESEVEYAAPESPRVELVEPSQSKAEPSQMSWEPTQPESGEIVASHPESSQGPPFTQASLASSEGASQSQKPPKKKKRVKGF